MTAVARVMDDPGQECSSGFFPATGSSAEEPGRFGGVGAPASWAAPVALPREGAALEGAIARALQKRIGDDRYDLWFDRKTRFTLAGRSLIVEAANAFVVRWIVSKFSEELRAVACEVVGSPLDICVRISDQVAPPRQEAGMPPASLPSPAAPPIASACAPAAAAVINPRYTLEEFVIGPSNQLAFHAAVRVAEKPGAEYSPLFLHGHCGLGKTHLLQGICNRFARLHPTKKWLYITGEQFTNDFLEAIKTHKTAAFRKRIRNADLLVIDDVHFLANKKATQEEFLHTFNQIDSFGKQVVLASDCAPRQIQALSEQLSSRFISGMVLRIDSPDLPTRLEILRRRAAKNSWNISDAVLMHIARTATSSVRELEGLLLQVVAGIRLINAGSGEAGGVIASIRERTAMRGPVPVERILACVAEHFALDASAITGSGREKTVSLARSIAMYLARQHTGMSFPEIGRALGNKNHSTVIAAFQRTEALVLGGQILCWNTPTGPRHQSTADALHDLEAAIRRIR